jgi:hypothetical protein
LDCNTKKAKKQTLNLDGSSKQKSKQEIEAEVAEGYMVKHIREVIHVVGSYDRFRKIVKMAIDTDTSGK